MSKTRLEAFSDGVIAIIITIMVLELKVPHNATWGALAELTPVFLTYALSFINVGIYWSNHHHLLHATQHVNGAVLIANLHLLFWLSLIPFTTGWMGENHLASIPTAVYGVVLIASGIAYTILTLVIVHTDGPTSKLKAAIGDDFKGKISLVIYAIGITMAFVIPWLGAALYVLVALMWFIPDRRIERSMQHPD
jgi:uncharacterized membrane protein